jgi:hypothetical protein
MEHLNLTTETVLAAFSKGKSGVAAAAAEFGISRYAIYQWKKGEQIPAERRLHLYLKRPDIIEKIKQGATQPETLNGTECPTSRSSDAAETTYMESGAVAQSSAAEPAQY